MKMNLKYFLIQFILCLSTILLLTSSYNCTCSSCGKNDKVDVPKDILTKAESFIKSRTGDDFFEKYITLDFQLTKHTPPYYEMVYNLSILEKPYVNGLIKFTVDTSGNVITNRDITGIPNCFRSAGECDFNVDEKRAIQIARENSFEEGIKEWKVEFIWNPQRELYVWHILSTFQEIEGEVGYRADGKGMFINPSGGDVIEINPWRIN